MFGVDINLLIKFLQNPNGLAIQRDGPCVMDNSEVAI